jgi:hypothetical protein
VRALAAGTARVTVRDLLLEGAPLVVAELRVARLAALRVVVPPAVRVGARAPIGVVPLNDDGAPFSAAHAALLRPLAQVDGASLRVRARTEDDTGMFGLCLAVARNALMFHTIFFLRSLASNRQIRRCIAVAICGAWIDGWRRNAIV